MKAAVRLLLVLTIVAVPAWLWAQSTPPPTPAPAPAPVATAAPPPPNDPMPMDLDGDGVVTAMEHAAGARSLFEHMDANHDERVTREEMLNFQREVLGVPIAPPSR
ncbi:hypothetical protein HIV01_015695 [Lysobacter arenosi]|jgi:hypothetical protein|uniref:EF-hand domain-containing protein n=1 Tax=Lysobacter arenosi TaxID=2795387 RepID=A0ABX7RBD5_9GAMM|nr:hypothetical protein [Lysobacter arenosi]QSX74601.1 hypothetical protein HIV01_015695 [Lysobacter arenosi]